MGSRRMPKVHVALIREAPGAGDEASGRVEMYKVNAPLNDHRGPDPWLTHTPFSFVAPLPVEDLGRLENSKALADFLIKTLDQGGATRCISLATKLEGNAQLSKSYMKNGDVVVILVVPRRVTKKGSGDLLDLVNFRDALEEATTKMRSTALQTYKRLIRSRENPRLIPLTTGTVDESRPRLKPVRGICVWRDGSNPPPTSFKEEEAKAQLELEEIKKYPRRYTTVYEEKIRDAMSRAKKGLLREELEQSSVAYQRQRPGEPARYVQLDRTALLLPMFEAPTAAGARVGKAASAAAKPEPTV